MASEISVKVIKTIKIETFKHKLVKHAVMWPYSSEFTDVAYMNLSPQ